MSTKYRDSKDIPNEVLADRLKELSNYCTKNDMPSEFSMRIPCELDRDADVVLGEASRRLRTVETGGGRTPCGDCGEFQSTVIIPMPQHWASSRTPRSFCVDACIATEILQLVYVHGVRTMASCCGHARKIPATVIVAEEHIGVMEGLGYEHMVFPDDATAHTGRTDIFVIPAERVTHIGPLPTPKQEGQG